MKAKILSYESKLRERIIEGLIEQIGNKNRQASDVVDSFYTLMMDDPISAINKLTSYIEQARDVNENRAFVEAIAGGPNHDWTGPILDIFGIAYPSLKREARTKGLEKILNFLDGLNYFNSQSNVELINEPWLVADIVINRSLYWCGYEEYTKLLRSNRTWRELEPHMKSIRSAFWFAIAVTRPKYSSLELRTAFYKEFPTLIDRTKDAIAAITFNHAQDTNKRDGTIVEDYIQKSLSKYDPLLNNDIRSKMEEKKWIRMTNYF